MGVIKFLLGWAADDFAVQTDIQFLKPIEVIPPTAQVKGCPATVGLRLGEGIDQGFNGFGFHEVVYKQLEWGNGKMVIRVSDQ
jgi:hypothetical protein